MAGRKRRKPKLSSEPVTRTLTTDNSSDDDSELHKTWSDLPADLLETILSLLSFRDNIRASAVCKRWKLCALSARVTNQPPWLMYFPKSSNLYEFYDPARRRTYFMELPELSDSQVCHTKDGWLLLRKPNTQNVFFFNPFSQETIELPKFKLTFQIVAFSCQPTAGTSCIVLTLKHVSPTEVEISTCSPGSTEWVTSQYANRSSFLCSMWNKIVFCNGRFYCLSLTGRVGVFDPSERTWTVLAVPPPKCPESVFVKYWSKWKGKFMAVSGGEIVVVCTCTGQNPNVFRLDEEKMVWEEMTSLNGLTLFVSSVSSHSRTDLNGNMRNNVFFPKVRFFGRRCTCYSMDDGRYYPCKQPYDWGELDPFARIWIDAPGDLSSFLEKDSTLLQF